MKNKPVRILVWCWGRRGGGPRYTLEIARALSRIPSLEVHLSLSRQAEIYDETRALNLPGFDVDTFSGLYSGILKTLCFQKTAAARLIQYLEKEGIDIVLCTMGHVWSGLIAKNIRSNRRRYIYTVHDASPHNGDAHIGWKWILESNLKCADGVLVLSNYVREELIRRYNYPGHRIWVTSHGPLKINRHAPCPVPLSTQPRRLLFFGRILPYKGLSLLIDSFNLIADRHDLQLSVVGGGNPGKEKSRLLAHPRIFFDNRWIPENELASVFNTADIVVLPYLEASQSGVIAIAYGLGLPVIVTPVGGLQEQVINGKSGMIADEITPESFAEALAALCTDTSLYFRCCQGARQLGDHEKEWNQIADTTANIFGDVFSMSAFSGAVTSNRIENIKTQA